jgi:SPP1 family phage portal protein
MYSLTKMTAYPNPFHYTPGKLPTEKEIVHMIGVKQVQNQTLNRLEEYYLGKQDILLKPTFDITLPSNKIVTNYCQVIVDFYSTYLLGKPIQYKAKDEALLAELNRLMRYNDAHDVDVINNQKANIMGAAAEQVYVDSMGELRFTNIDFREIIFVYNKDLEEELNCVIKYYRINPTDSSYRVELWTPTLKVEYEMNEAMATLRKLSETTHDYGAVPFIEYINNDYRASSFGGILTLQDALNTLSSLEVDDYESFVDSFLGIYNAAGTTSDDIVNMKANRVLLLDGESKAEWVVKNSNPAQIEQIKKYLIDSIHKVASLPDLSDQNFSSNASGVAIKYKMIGAENMAAKQERKFKRGLQKRLELIMHNMSLKNSAEVEYTDIEITFNRNMIGADLEVAQLINLVGDRIPIANLASQFSFITDADLAIIAERDKKEDTNNGTGSVSQPDM